MDRTPTDDARHFLKRSYADMNLSTFYATIDRFKNGKVCLKNISIDNTYFASYILPDRFYGKEDHIWVKNGKLFKDAGINIGDKVCFYGEVYQYVRSDGSVDFSIRNIQEIEKIDAYWVPTDDVLSRQAVNDIICGDLCMFSKHCNGLFCMMSEKEHKMLEKALRGYSANRSE